MGNYIIILTGVDRKRYNVELAVVKMLEAKEAKLPTTEGLDLTDFQEALQRLEQGSSYIQQGFDGREAMLYSDLMYEAGLTFEVFRQVAYTHSEERD